MKSRAEIENALAKARAAGHPDAQVLAAALAEMDKPGALKVGAQHATNAFFGGFGDEIAGGMGALSGGNYREQRDLARASREAGAQAQPAAAIAGDVVGTGAAFALPPLRALGASRGATLGTRAVKALPVGAAAGAVYGAGEAPELANVPEYAAKGGALGAVAGPALEGLASVGKGVARFGRKALALKARIAQKAAGALGLQDVADVAGRAEQALLPSPSLSNSKARALQRRAEQQGGFTVDPNTLASPEHGIAFSPHPELERTMPELTPRALRDYVGEAGPLLKDPANKLGGWKSGDKWYLDVSRLTTDPQEAMREAAKAGQKSIYNIGQGKEIQVPNPAKRKALSRRKRTTTRSALIGEATAGLGE